VVVIVVVAVVVLVVVVVVVVVVQIKCKFITFLLLFIIRPRFKKFVKNYVILS
jgi:hypothetical protein